jgi:S1-C subfamily serine protease
MPHPIKFTILIISMIAVSACANTPPRFVPNTDAIFFPDWLPAFPGSISQFSSIRLTLLPPAKMRCTNIQTTMIPSSGKTNSVNLGKVVEMSRVANGTKFDVDIRMAEGSLNLSGVVNRRGEKVESVVSANLGNAVNSNKLRNFKKMIENTPIVDFSYADKTLVFGNSATKDFGETALSGIAQMLGSAPNWRQAVKQKSLVVGRSIVAGRAVIVVKYVATFTMRNNNLNLKFTTAGHEWVDEQTGMLSGWKVKAVVSTNGAGGNKSVNQTNSLNCEFDSPDPMIASKPPPAAPKKPIENVAPRQSPKPTPPSVGGSSGSGFFVSRLGHIVTNQHVVKECKYISVGDNAMKQVKAEIIDTDNKNDLALLKISSTELASAETKSLIRKLGIKVARRTAPLSSDGLLRSEDVELGERVMVSGYPYGEIFSDTIKVTGGMVSATRGMGDDRGQFQIDAAVQPGNSGGPIYDGNGNIVGVVVSQLNKLKVAKVIGSLPENVNFGIKASTVRQFLTSAGLPTKWSQRSKPLSSRDLAKIAKNQTLMVVCHR